MRERLKRTRPKKWELNRAGWLFETCLWYFPGGCRGNSRDIVEKEMKRVGRK